MKLSQLTLNPKIWPVNRWFPRSSSPLPSGNQTWRKFPSWFSQLLKKKTPFTSQISMEFPAVFDDNGGSYPRCGVLRPTGSCRRVNFRRCGALRDFILLGAAGHGEIHPGRGLQPKIKSMKAMIFWGKTFLFGWLNYISKIWNFTTKQWC